MGILDERQYAPECSDSDLPLDMYYDKTTSFGHFTEDGSTYVIERRDTPRPWLHYLTNEKVYSCVSNNGGGFMWHARGVRVTKQWERDWYYTHDPCGKRTLLIETDGVERDFFANAEGLTEYITPGSVRFVGKLDDLRVEVTIFVPNKLPCECWRVRIENRGKAKQARITVGQDWHFLYPYDFGRETPPSVHCEDNVIIASKLGLFGAFAVSGSRVLAETEDYLDATPSGIEHALTRARLTQTVSLEETADVYVVSAASEDEAEARSTFVCLTSEGYEAEFSALQKTWRERVERNRCELPDKNAERFLNYWLKNQLCLTYFFDRGHPVVGYRDSLQDAWGYMLVDPEEARNKLVRTLAHMMVDGRCPRQYYRWENKDHDMRDFSDSIVWVADAIASYIKETGDTGILDEQIPFLDSTECTSVEDHILRGLNSLYTLRGTNGLVRMRGGDWLDGLEGINKYGEDATSVWVTVAAFHAQNVLAELFDFLGKSDEAALMRARSAEYREIVNRVAWDGNWYTYAFFEDGEPIGSSKNLEGKIYANVQTWAVFSGIVDDPDKVRRIEKAMNRYLQTPFGPMLLYPPYVFHGERCGRLQRQRPGTFANGAVYNHAAGFKVFADVARGDYDDALDTFLRAIPNHPDNSDFCRTGEPYAVGNVYYGINHPRMGMNLFTWWTATVAWLIHGGFEQILGVKAGYNGLIIEPHVPVDWETYRVQKRYRGTLYRICFERTEGECGIWVDGVKQAGNCITSDLDECSVTVKFKE